MKNILGLLKNKVDVKTVLSIVGGGLTLASMIVDKKAENLATNEAAEKAAKIVMEKLSGKQN